MRILWVSNAPWVGSGYGEQTDLFTKRFATSGHDVAIGANHGLTNMPTSWHGIPVFPAQDEDSIQTFAKHWEADVVILLYDTWGMHPAAWPEVEMAMWAPIDHIPPPPGVLEVLSHERVQPIAMSRFGEAMLEEAGKSPLYSTMRDPLYVPHGVDTELFCPRPEDRSAVRAEVLKVPEDAFLVGMVAANNGWNPQLCRKSFPQAFDAFGRFLKEHDDAYLYVHSRMSGGGFGQDLELVAKMMDIPDERFRTPRPNAWHLGIMDREYMAGLYNAFDVLLNPSMSEGFGVAIIEAQACGVPVITSKFSSMPELTRAGWMVDGDRFWNDPFKAFALMPFVDSILSCLNRAYKLRGSEKLRTTAREFALTYDADTVMERYWAPVLERLAKSREIPPLLQSKNDRHAYDRQMISAGRPRKKKRR